MTPQFLTVDHLLHDLWRDIRKEGNFSGDRTGVGTQRIFGLAGKIWAGTDLLAPVIKPVNIRAVLAEFWCFTNGVTNVDELKAYGCGWWEANLQDANNRWGTPDNRDLGPVYGAQWVKPYICGSAREGQWMEDPGYEVPVYTDQLTQLIQTIKERPTDRRMYVTAWNPEDFDQMALPPCYHGFQVFVEDGRLDMMWHMRSCDTVLGLPHDILFHQFLMMALAAECGLSVGWMTMTLGDTHIYDNAQDAVNVFMERALNLGSLATRRPRIAKKLTGFRSVHPDNINYLFEGEYLPLPNVKVAMAV